MYGTQPAAATATVTCTLASDFRSQLRKPKF
jgi:hypothetical protein